VRISSLSRGKTVDASIEAITEPSVSTYLQPGIEQSGVTPVVSYTSDSLASTTASGRHVPLYPAAVEENVYLPVTSADSSHLPDTQVFRKRSVVSNGEENVPVIKSTSISEIGDKNQDFSETGSMTVSINGVPNISAANNNSFILISSKGINNITRSEYNSSESIMSNSSNISLDLMVDIQDSYSQSIHKPLVNSTHLITRDFRNNSESSPAISSPTSVSNSHALDHTLPLSLPLLHLNPPIARTAKSAGYLPSQLHPQVLSTTSPSRDEPDTTHGYKLGPNNTDEFLNPTHTKIAIKDSDVSQHEEGDSRVIWISKTSHVTGMAPEHWQMVPAAKHESSNARISHLDAEMADSPYNPPERSTLIGPRIRIFGNGVSKPPPASSHELVLPTDKPENGTDDEPLDSGQLATGSREKGQGKEILKVIPPLMTSSKVLNTASQSGQQSDNINKVSYVSPLNSENIDGNASLGSVTDDANASAVIKGEETLPSHTKNSVLAGPSIPELKQVGNVTTVAKDIEENETSVITVLPTIMPVSDGRVAAATPGGSHHGLGAASITGISLGILVFAALVGKIYSDTLLTPCFMITASFMKEVCSLIFVIE
jgi:hypothetical protein